MINVEYANETKEVLLSNGGQKIKISAINKETERVIEEKKRSDVLVYKIEYINTNIYITTA